MVCFGLVCFCLACVGHARELQAQSHHRGSFPHDAWDWDLKTEDAAQKFRSAKSVENPSKALATFFFALEPRDAFNPSASADTLGTVQALSRNVVKDKVTHMGMLAEVLNPATGNLDPIMSRRSRSSPQMSEADVDYFETFRQNDETQGVVFRDDVVGTGDTAEQGNVVVVKYTGRLMKDGSEIRAGELTFRLGDPSAGVNKDEQVILGLDEGIEGMRVGGKRTLRIPSAWGYGVNGKVSKGMREETVIPPDADLEFDCELKTVASDPLSEFIAEAGIGLNFATALPFIVILLPYIVTFVSSILSNIPSPDFTD